MKTAVVYFSHSGATRRYARAEADARQATLLEVRATYTRLSALTRGCPAARRQKEATVLPPLPSLAGYERVVLMAPVWAGWPAPPFNNMIALLPVDTEVEVLLTSSSGHADDACRPAIRHRIEARGCKLLSQRDIRTAR